ncbi:MAG: N-acetylmuramoyl-L-alanine amidase [Treponema sp.]|jgi:N-acetylmuramoyl-L-alanine amidase|nr:N-acetylmuramoyl-L-alanine amidase [Treponema sp.]
MFLSMFTLLLSGPGTPIRGAENLGNSPGRVFTLDDTLAFLGLTSGSVASRPRTEAPEFHWDPFFSSGIFVSAGHYLSFQTGEPGDQGFFLLDGTDIYNVPVPYLVRGLLYFPEEFVTTAEQVLFPRSGGTIVENRPLFRIAAIIVDPGHGGKDPGAIGTFTENGRSWSSIEKDITLKVSREVHALLGRNYPGKRILLTRDRDVFPTLQERVDLANSVSPAENEAVIFISIHANASFNKNARGYEVWYLDPEYRRELIDRSKYGESAAIVNRMMEEEFTTESIMMGQNILRRMGEALGNITPNRGLKAEKWFVVKNAEMPAVLVELPFVTNREDAGIMADDAYLKKFADAIYKGIVDFVDTFERTGGFTAIQ